MYFSLPPVELLGDSIRSRNRELVIFQGIPPLDWAGPSLHPTVQGKRNHQQMPFNVSASLSPVPLPGHKYQQYPEISLFGGNTFLV